MSPRKKALDILIKVVRDGAYSNLELAAGLQDFSDLDRRLITNLVYGTLSNKIRMDFYLSQISSKPLEKLDTEILLILEMALYQHEMLDKVPDYAILNESVNLARQVGKKSAAPFVNGVLRKAFRSKIEVNSLKAGTAYEKSIRFSLPKWFCSMVLKQYGDKTDDILEKCKQTAPLTVRVNRLKTSGQECIALLEQKNISVKNGEVCPDALILNNHGFIKKEELFRAGYYTPQDEAAMMAAFVLNPRPGETVIDMCAAPGGKTTYLAQQMNNRGKIFACDCYPHKIEIIQQNCERMGAVTVVPVLQDALEERKEFLGMADKILADVPCSGLGLIRKKPEIALRTDLSQIQNLENIQQKILERAGTYLKPGGEMVYATCTINKEENEWLFQRFLEENPEFEPVPIQTYFAGKDFQCQNTGWIQILPGEYGMDGFFIGKVRKRRNAID